MPIYFVKGCWMFLDDLFWSNVVGILFQKIKKQKILTYRNCTNWYYVVSIVFVLHVVSRVKSYVHIILDTRTLVLCTNYFGTVLFYFILLTPTSTTIIKIIFRVPPTEIISPIISRTSCVYIFICTPGILHQKL